MAVYDNKEILIKYEELPKINGVRIESIYLKTFDTRQIKDAWVKPEHASYYYICYPYFSSDNPQLVRTLPEEIQKIFDEPQKAIYLNQETGEEREVNITKVTSLWYRTKCSGNGSFIDNSIHLQGAGKGNRDGFIDVRRNCKSIVSKETTGLIEKLIKTLNVQAEIPVLSEEEYTYYPSTTLRRVDGLNYPDPVCDGWRWLHGMPYVPADNNRKTIRVLDEALKCHTYLRKVETDELEIGREYVIVHFKQERGKELYCNIQKWADSKENLAGQYIKYRVDKVGSKYIHCTVMDQDPRYRNEQYEYNPFYEIVRIRNSEEL